MPTKDRLQELASTAKDDALRRAVEDQFIRIPYAGLHGRVTWGFNPIEVERREPASDIFEDQNSLIIQIDTPGVDRKNLSLNVSETMLMVSGKRAPESEDVGNVYHLRERGYSAFERALLLPPNLDVDHAIAEYKYGVLRVIIPKRGKIVRPYRAEPASEGIVDSNYQAYLRDLPELQQTLTGYLVAYADGQRVAAGRDAQELSEKIPDAYRQRSLFIKDVPGDESLRIRFRRPFFVRHQE